MVGRESSQDVVVGVMYRNLLVRHRQSPAEPYASVIGGSEAPAKRSVFDIVLHKDVYKECIPLFRLYSTGGGEAFVNPNDPLGELRRLHVECDIQSVPTGHVTEMKTPEIPFYQQMLRSECEAFGWDLSEFRAFRVRLDYPVFSAHMHFVIPLSDRANA